MKDNTFLLLSVGGGVVGEVPGYRKKNRRHPLLQVHLLPSGGTVTVSVRRVRGRELYYV